ncbi:MAG: DNA repair exonuclease [Clostridia bacterium]|nr:DNA repair exonuclease [Clostridia bacterium]
MSFKLLQFGDLHLDAAYARLSPEKAAERRLAARSLLTEIISAARSQGVAMILCTGDLFDSATPYRDTVEAVAEAFRTAEIPVLIAPGNHDFYTRTSPYAVANWSENVHIFRSETPETIDFPQLNCTVTGCAYLSEQPALKPLETTSAPSGKTAIFLGHGDFGVADSPYAAFPAAEINKSGFDLIALGHTHKPEIQTVGKTLVVQNGSVEGHGYDEAGERGYYLVTLGDVPSATHIGSSGSRAVRVTIADTITETDAILAAIRAAHSSPADRTMVRVECVPVDPTSLASALGAEYLDFKLISRTPTATDTAQSTHSPLVSMFLRKAKAVEETVAGEAEITLAQLARQFGEAAMLHREAPRGSTSGMKGATSDDL